MRSADLDLAAELLDAAGMKVQSHGHDDQARRLHALADLVRDEQELGMVRQLWFSPVRKRSVRTLSTILRHDDRVRALRRERGLWVPDDELLEVAA